MEVFGESLGLDAARQARGAEAQGFDGIVAVDHFYSGRPGGSPPKWRVEPLVALGVAAAATSKLRLGAMVMNVNFHHPAVIAHAIASLNELSGGRAELGLGAGWYAPEHVAWGLPWGDARERSERLIESAEVCRAMLENRGAVSHHGAHFGVESTVQWQWPARPPVPVVVGAAGRRLLCRAAEVANRIDLLHASVGGRTVVDEAHARHAERVESLLDEARSHADASGNALKVSASVTAVVVPADGAQAARARIAPLVTSTPELLERDLLYVVGTQDELLEKIRLLASLGVDRVHVIPAEPEPARTLAAVRELLSDIQGTRPAERV